MTHKPLNMLPYQCHDGFLLMYEGRLRFNPVTVLRVLIFKQNYLNYLQYPKHKIHTTGTDLQFDFLLNIINFFMKSFTTMLIILNSLNVLSYQLLKQT